MTHDTDRQLLLGLLAFQNHFIDQRALLTAFGVWSRNQTRSLGEVLVEQRAIAREQMSLLEMLAAQFLSKFQDDAAAGLSHVGAVDPSLCDELKTLAGPQLQRSLTRVGTAKQTRPDDPLNTLPHSVGHGTSQGTRFRILRPHARGGLGEVFVAEDGELHREVALKQIKANRADDAESRMRFVFEAEITGGLEHPNIVPVYGLGSYEDGRPFYAMRFIRGDNLQEAIQRYHNSQRKMPASARALEFRKLLQRFLEVCNAVDYAHSRGVLHRDLKPGNIMLGRYGETLLVDWGLAKATGKPSLSDLDAPIPEHALRVASGGGSETIGGTAVGTPSYMSPEQAAGRVAELSPATDVYSLGATLYEVLTGQQPVTGNEVTEILRKVEKGDFARPRELTSDVPRPLEAICLKAMELKPENRYRSARALADDVEHWLADERVGAYAEPILAEVGRWGRRHRTAVVAAAVLMVTTIVGLVVGLAAVAAEQRATERERDLKEQQRTVAEVERQKAVAARDDEAAQRAAATSAREEEAKQRQAAQAAEVRANGLLLVAQENERRAKGAEMKAEHAKMLAEKAAEAAKLAEAAAKSAGDEAKQQRDRADKQRDEVLDTLGDFVFDVQDELQDIPGLQPLKDRLLDLAIARLDGIEMTDDESLIERTAAAAQFKRAEILIASGKADEGLQILGKVQQVFEDAAKLDPAGREPRHDLAVVYQRLGDSYRRLELDSKQTEKFYRLSAEILSALAEGPAAEPPTADEAKRDLAVVYGRLGDLLPVGSESEPARRDWYQRSLDLRRQLLPPPPKDPPDDVGLTAEFIRAARDLAVAHDRLGGLDFDAANVAAARGHYEQARSLRNKVAQLDACGLRTKYELALSSRNLGECEFSAKNYSAAASLFGEGLKATAAMAELDACNPEVQRTLSLALERSGAANLRLEQFDEARRLLEECLSLRRRTGDLPADARSRNDLAAAYFNLAEVAIAEGANDEARRLLEKVQVTLAKSDANDATAQNILFRAAAGLGDIGILTRKYDEARNSYRQALTTQSSSSQTRTPDEWVYWANVRKNLGMSLHALGQYDEALDEYEELRKVLEKLPPDDDIAKSLADLRVLSDAARKKEMPPAADRSRP